MSDTFLLRGRQITLDYTGNSRPVPELEGSQRAGAWEKSWNCMICPCFLSVKVMLWEILKGHYQEAFLIHNPPNSQEGGGFVLKRYSLL